MTHLLLAAVLLAPLPQDASGTPSAPGTPGLPAQDRAITAGELLHHVRVLAADDLDGREAGFPGGVVAQDYVTRALARTGAQPMGEEGTFHQSLEAVRVEHRSAPRIEFRVRTTGAIEEGVYGEDFNLTVRGAAKSTGLLPIFRVSDANDMQSPTLPDHALFVRFRHTKKGEPIRRDRTYDEGAWGLELRVLDKATQGKARGAPPTRVEFGPPAEDESEQVTVRGRMRETLLWLGYDAIRLVCDEVRMPVPVANVIGMVPGTDPELSKDVLLLHTTYDHIGAPPDRLRPQSADRVRNGANEAAACAALLEIAEALAADPPKRTVVFLFATATPGQRLGLTHFLANPTVDLERVDVALLLERMGVPAAREHSAGKLHLTGAASLGLVDALATGGVPVLSGDDGKETRRPRLVGRTFAKAGIPSRVLSLSHPNQDVDPFTDEPDTIDGEAVHGAATAAYAAVRLLADGLSIPPPARPEPGAGQPGDE